MLTSISDVFEPSSKGEPGVVITLSPRVDAARRPRSSICERGTSLSLSFEDPTVALNLHQSTVRCAFRSRAQASGRTHGARPDAPGHKNRPAHNARSL